MAYLIYKRRMLGDIGDVPSARLEDPTARKEPLTKEERDRILAIALMAIFEIFFLMAFEQAGSSMNFFAEERTQRQFLGKEIPAPWFQSVNPLVIMIFAPFFSSMWRRLAARGKEPNTPMKFAWGLFLLSLGFLVMVFGARASEGGVRVSPLWLASAYVLHTWGELCLSPIGLSMVTKLAPARFGSLMMGAWFVSYFIANLLAGLVAGTIEKFERGEVFHLLGGQADFFLVFFILPLLAAGFAWAISGKVQKLMHGRA
jgi:POT family proton-dependent oligopeptide transporter